MSRRSIAREGDTALTPRTQTAIAVKLKAVLTLTGSEKPRSPHQSSMPTPAAAALTSSTSPSPTVSRFTLIHTMIAKVSARMYESKTAPCTCTGAL